MTEFMTTLAASGAHSEIAHTVHLAVAMISIAAVVGVATKFIRIPYTAALVLTGLAIALSGLAPEGVRITQDLVLLLFLPPLLFQAGLHTNLNTLRAVWAPVLLMAFPGVILTSCAVGAAMKPILAEAVGPAASTWTIALLFGVVIAPTDPISVMATFKKARAPEKLKTVIEGESLFNDGTAVAIFAILRAAVFGGAAGLASEGELAHQSVSLVEVGLNFVKVAGLGTVIGLALGLAAFGLLHKLDDHTLEVAITVALAWGSFVLAEMLHASGVISCVVAALIMGNYGRVLSMTPETRETLTGFWDSLDFVVNSILFLLIGFELSDPAVGGVERLTQPLVLAGAGATFAAMLIARGVLIYPAIAILKPGWPGGWRHVIFLAGLRGSLSLALILGLPDGPLRNYLTPVAFIVVLVSLLGQGMCIPLVIKAAGVEQEDPVHH